MDAGRRPPAEWSEEEAGEGVLLYEGEGMSGVCGGEGSMPCGPIVGRIVDADEDDEADEGRMEDPEEEGGAGRGLFAALGR